MSPSSDPALERLDIEIKFLYVFLYFSIPFRNTLTYMRIEICRSTIILGLSGISGRFEIFEEFTAAYVSDCFIGISNLGLIHTLRYRGKTPTLKCPRKSLTAVQKSHRRHDPSQIIQDKKFFVQNFAYIFFSFMIKYSWFLQTFSLIPSVW